MPCPLCGSWRRDPVVHAADRLSPARGHSSPAHHFTVVRCRDCGLAFTDPRPTAAAIGAYYPDAYHAVPSGSRLATLEERYRRRQHNEAVRWLRARRPHRGLVLDVGCGAGDLLCALRADGWQVRGIEPGLAGVTAARRRGLAVSLGRFDDPPHDGATHDGPGAGDEPAAGDGDTGHIPLDSGAYDVVVFSGVIEHLHHPLTALRRACGLLAPGGLVAVLHVPLFDSPEARFFGPRWLALDLPRHLTHFEHATLPRMAAAAGLVVESTEPYSRRHSAATLVASLVPALQKHRFYLDAERRGPAGAGLAARKGVWLATVTAARPAARLAAFAGRGNHCSYFLVRRPG